jgi:aspartate aminotransferase
MYSSPPIHGARIVAEVLSDPELRNQWSRDCQSMADRYGS